MNFKNPQDEMDCKNPVAWIDPDCIQSYQAVTSPVLSSQSQALLAEIDAMLDTANNSDAVAA